MTSTSNPEPKPFYMARLAFSTAGWTHLTVLSLFIAITGIGARSVSNLNHKRDDDDLDLFHWLEPRRVSFSKSRSSLRGMDLGAAQKGLLYTCAALSIISLLMTLWNLWTVYRLCFREYTREEVALAPFVIHPKYGTPRTQEEEARLYQVLQTDGAGGSIS